MTAVSHSSTSKSTDPTATQWEAVGVWPGGSAVAVALTRGPHGTQGLLASQAGAYGWQQPGLQVVPLVDGLSDLNVITVAFAAGHAGQATAFAATSTGRLYHARIDGDGDPALTWQEVSTWAGLGLAVVIAPSPAYADDQTLFIGTPAGFFRTQDGGQSWESCNFGLLDEYALCLACAPNFAENEVLWAGTAGGGLYRSRNSARAWRESGIGLPDAAVQALAVSPNFAADQTLLAGMEEHGIYRSCDGGATWSPYALDGQSVNALAWAHADWIWAGTENGLWRVAAESGTTEQVAAEGAAVISVDATPQGQVALGLYSGGLWLTDDGHVAQAALVWQQPELAVHAPPVVTHVDEALYALDLEGERAISLDGGSQWEGMEHPLPGAALGLDSVRGTTPDGKPQQIVYAATEAGLARWDAARSEWEALGQAHAPHGLTWGVVLSPHFAQDQMVMALGPDQTLRLSKDAGITLQDIAGPWRDESLLQARFGPAGDGALLALTVRPAESGHVALTLWESTDYGQRWEVLAGLNSGVASAQIAWPHDDKEQAIFVATQHRVIKLFQHGTPPELQVLQHFFDESLRVTALVTAPDYVQSGIVWAATSQGLYRSVDRGANWALMLDLPQSLPVVWLQVTLTHVKAITLGGRVWRAAL